MSDKLLMNFISISIIKEQLEKKLLGTEITFDKLYKKLKGD